MKPYRSHLFAHNHILIGYQILNDYWRWSWPVKFDNLPSYYPIERLTIYVSFIKSRTNFYSFSQTAFILKMLKLFHFNLRVTLSIAVNTAFIFKTIMYNIYLNYNYVYRYSSGMWQLCSIKCELIIGIFKINTASRWTDLIM